MALGDPATPIDSDVELNNPAQRIALDELRATKEQIETLQRSLNTEVIRQIKHLYDLLSEPYPPP